MEYEAYEDMAVDALERICKKVRSKWEVLKIGIAHKLGSCPVGDVSVCIVISSAHRKEAIKAVEFCIDDLKASVPIWKKEVYDGAAAEWKENKESAAPTVAGLAAGASRRRALLEAAAVLGSGVAVAVALAARRRVSA